MNTERGYLQTQPYLQNRFQRVGRKLAFCAENQKEGQEWRRKTLKKLKSLTGYDTMLATDPSPRITEEIDLGDIASLIAPRPLLVETGTEDGLNGASGLGNVYPQIRTIRKAYRLFGTQKMLCHDVFEGAHRWHGTKAIPWMEKNLM
jgi:hypothetical protein